MRELSILVKYQIKDAIFGKFNKQKTASKFIGVLFMVIAALGVIYVYNSIMAEVKDASIVGSISYLLGVFWATLSSFAISLYSLDKSKRDELLMSFPIKRESILLSKIMTLYASIFMTFGVFFLPALAVIFFHTFDFGYLLRGLIIQVFTPLLPLSAGMAIMMLIISIFGNILKNAYFRSALNIIFVIGLILGNFYLSTSANISGISLNAVYFIKWADDIITGYGIEILYFIFGTLLVFALSLIISWITYNRVWAVMDSTGDKSLGKVGFGRKNQYMSLISRQISIILNTPAFATQIIISAILPVILLVIYIASGIIPPYILDDFKLEAFLLFVAFALVQEVSTTSITREGKNFWQNKIIPVSSITNLRSRQMLHFILNIVPSTISVIGFGLYIKMPIVFLISITVIMIITGIALGTIDLIINILRPRLDWENPKKAIKDMLSQTVFTISRFAFGYLAYLVLSNLKDTSSIEIFRNIDSSNIFGSPVLMETVVRLGLLGLVMLVISEILLLKVGIKGYERIEA